MTTETETLDTHKTPCRIDKWVGGILQPNAVDDPRPEPTSEVDYEQWMASHHWSHVQNLGGPEGFSVEVWVLKGQHKWIMSIDAGGATNDVLVEGFADYMDMMAMMSPIVMASMFDGEAMASIFEQHRETTEARKAMNEMGKEVLSKVRRSMEPCDCPRCVQTRAEEAKNQIANAN